MIGNEPLELLRYCSVEDKVILHKHTAKEATVYQQEKQTIVSHLLELEELISLPKTILEIISHLAVDNILNRQTESQKALRNIQSRIVLLDHDPMAYVLVAHALVPLTKVKAQTVWYYGSWLDNYPLLDSNEKLLTTEEYTELMKDLKIK